MCLLLKGASTRGFEEKNLRSQLAKDVPAREYGDAGQRVRNPGHLLKGCSRQQQVVA